MNNETKSLIGFTPKKLIRHFSKDRVTLAAQPQDKDVDLNGAIEDAPAEHIKSTQPEPASKSTSVSRLR